jgi:5-methylcytosine-specific restriction endonuclease McrA
LPYVVLDHHLFVWYLGRWYFIKEEALKERGKIMSSFQTLLLTPWMQPHRVVTWQNAICRLVSNEIEVLESYEETVSSPSVTFKIPSVARITTKIPMFKKGIKFSRINVLTRDNFICQYCGNRFPRRELNYDHVVPRSQGGKTVWQNVVTSCYTCNSRKAGRTPEQARMRLLKVPVRPKVLPLPVPAIPILKCPEEWGFYLSGTPKHMFMVATG